ncbi:MAG TPA: heavy-metal-associated domain-containing protein [Patescibacteria group bacterium]|nr:heavy-metal-associated domain-containing protein [Patescibacteria group bacterium]
MKKLFCLSLLAMLSSPAFAVHGGAHVHVSVNGLVCDFCAVAMNKTFKKKEAVQAVDVNLTSKIVRIDLKPGQSLADDEIRKGIIDAGYEVVSIKRD